MRIGISTACFYPQALEQTFSQIQSLGVCPIEIFFNTESEFHPPLRNDLQQRIAQAGLEVISIHPYTSLMEGMLLFSDYTRRTRDGFAQYERYLESAQAFGAKYLTLHGERSMPNGTPERPQVVERRIERYHRLCELASQYGITITQENVAWCKSSDLAFLQTLFEQVPELCYTLDLKQAYRAGQDWQNYYKVIAPRLKNIHINDFDAQHSCLLPGEGSFCYESLFDCLLQDGYTGDALIEVYRNNYQNIEQLEDAVMFLQHEWKRIENDKTPRKNVEKSARISSI